MKPAEEKGGQEPSVAQKPTIVNHKSSIENWSEA